MRGLSFLFVLAAAFAGDGTIKNEEFNFEITIPGEGIDWKSLAPPKDKPFIKVHFKTAFPDGSSAEIQLMVLDIGRKKRAADLVERWKDTLEGERTPDHSRVAHPDKLGGRDAETVDLKEKTRHVTYTVAPVGRRAYVFYVVRTGTAIGDADVEEEIDGCRASFKFLREVVEPDSPEEDAKPDPEELKRKEIVLEFWRLTLVKPEGMVRVATASFDASERTNSLVFKCKGLGEERCTIRVFAVVKGLKAYRPVKAFVDLRLKQFRETYPEKWRKEEHHKKWPVLLAKKAPWLKLVGRRKVTETIYWYFAECKNDRLYQIQIFLPGAAEKHWKAQIDDFLKNFKPSRKAPT